MESSNGYCPDCYFHKPQGAVDITLNVQGYYECPKCHLQTVWVAKEYPFLWILKERGSGLFRSMTHAELYSDVGGQNKRYLGGFEFFVKALALQRWKNDAGEWIETGSWWDNYVEFLYSGKSASYTKDLTYMDILNRIETVFEEKPTKHLEKATTMLSIELYNRSQIKLFIDSEVEEMTPEKWKAVEKNKNIIKS